MSRVVARDDLVQTHESLDAHEGKANQEDDQHHRKGLYLLLGKERPSSKHHKKREKAREQRVKDARLQVERNGTKLIGPVKLKPGEVDLDVANGHATNDHEANDGDRVEDSVDDAALQQVDDGVAALLVAQHVSWRIL